MYDQIVEEFKQFQHIKVIKSYTSDFLNSLEDEYLDAVYIDADHSYEGVKLDLNLSLKKVKKGGIIMGHDYTYDKFPGVVNAVNQFCEKNNLKIDILTEDGCPTYLIYKK
jgi:predicted O-methyltransferase YrrM